MEMRKQGGSEGQGTARPAPKAPQRQPAGEPMPNPEEQGGDAHPGTSMGQGGPSNQQTSSNQARPGQQTGGEQDLLQHAKQAGGEIVSKVQQQAGTQINQQKETAASQISQVANAVRRIRENIPQQEGGPLGRFVGDYGEKAANSLDRLSTYIREQDPQRLLNDVQDFGRRQPVLLLGGAFLLGFAGARLIRSSMASTGSQHGSRQMQAQTPTFTPQNVSGVSQSRTPGAV